MKKLIFVLFYGTIFLGLRHIFPTLWGWDYTPFLIFLMFLILFVWGEWEWQDRLWCTPQKKANCCACDEKMDCPVYGRDEWLFFNSANMIKAAIPMQPLFYFQINFISYSNWSIYFTNPFLISIYASRKFLPFFTSL